MQICHYQNVFKAGAQKSWEMLQKKTFGLKIAKKSLQGSKVLPPYKVRWEF